ncbi:MAG TPA: DUF2723 domain-containing protein [Flavobacteriaceae bacterium]|nr:DUF2723 domain-containing protein [Flavobacteriaceae bacterium]
MRDFKFNRWNTIIGWVVFVVALITYGSTVEPTTSFWDPGEFISTSAKLQVGHPPGAPFYQMVGAVFSTFAPDDTQIALLVNWVSVLGSAFAILFMFWSLTLLIRKISGPAEKMDAGTKMAVLGSAMVGSLSFSFTDSFWFNAVEAEVYALAMCFMAALFYIGLLWERDMLTPRGNRWLILIGFLIGLTFGVHFLGLLTIPAIGYMYYFKHVEKVTVKNFIVATIIVVGALLFVFLLLMPNLMAFFAASEIFFVNTVGLPFNSGSLIAALALIAFFYFALRYTRKKDLVKINVGLLTVLFVIIGFSSWVMLPIRANAGVNINENDPNNARNLLAYYNREQYPDNPLLYGPQYTDIFAGLDEKNPYVDEDPKYEQDKETNKYVIVNNWKNAKQNANSDHKTFLPRMWSTDNNHIENYMNMTGAVNFKIHPDYSGSEELWQLVHEVKTGYQQGRIDNDGLIRFLKEYGQALIVEKPSTSANFQFMFEYQFWYMYFRYFMWNFVGKQNDEQGKYTNLDGNWMSGITFIDSMFFGSQENLPDVVKNDPARNTYYFLPLILGLIGLFFHYDRDKRSFWVLMVLFLFTGIALKIYLNERPFEPRERDYALVGSFYAFAFWIGFGVYSIFDKLKKYLQPKFLAPGLTVVCLLAVPVLMAQQNWDDHDRSGKYTARAMAKNYLDSVDENGIIFTIGDNDTFPLWYVQEIEGYRTDIKIINTSLFATAWYIDQMQHKTYESEGVKTTLEHKDYTYGTNDVVLYQEDERMPDTMTVKNWLKYIKSDNPTTSVTLQNDHLLNVFPTKHLRLPVNKENVLKYGIVEEKDKDKIVSEIPINIGMNQVPKNTLMMLDVIANLDWTRPVYFSGGSYGDADYLWMKDYLELDGLAYKLVPIKTKTSGYDLGRIDVDKMYDRVMNWHWGNSGGDIYYDPQTRRNAISYRSNMARLATKLIEQKDYKRAEDILDLATEKMPVKKYGFYALVAPFIADYYEIGQKEKATALWDEVAEIYQQKLSYFAELQPREQRSILNEIYGTIERYRDLIDIVIVNDDEKVAREKAEEFNSYVVQFGNLYQRSEEMEYENIEGDLEEEIEEDSFEDQLDFVEPDVIP